MTMVEAVETSITAALDAGRIDATVHAAPIQALRELAKRAELGNEKDNVTFPTMLKYMDALGILPDEVTTETTTSTSDGKSSLHRMRGKFGSQR